MGGRRFIFCHVGFLIGGYVIANKEPRTFYSGFFISEDFSGYSPLLFASWLFVAVSVSAAWMPRPAHGSLALYPIYLQNIRMALTDDYGLVWLQPTWSLAVEEHFYLLLLSW